MQVNGQISPIHDDQRGLWFELIVDATRELARDADSLAALVTVTAQRSERGAAMASAAAEVIIMDRSLSMHRHGKLEEAKRAVHAAIEALADGTYFAVIAGNHAAEQVYPPDGTLRRATAQARDEARNQVANIEAVGGTAMSTWLTLADRLFGQATDAVRHAVLFTDGINEHETTRVLDSALDACRDHFVCDVRGIGVDWNPGELRRIAGALQGEVEAIIEITDLRDDFTRLMAHAQTLVVPRAYLRLKLDPHFRLESVRQIRPAENDLTGHQIPADGGVTDVPLLAWGEESRDYLVQLRVEPGTPTNEELRAARIDIVAESRPGQPLMPCARPAALAVRWLAHRQPPPVHRRVTEALDATRLSAATQAGLAAYARGDLPAALREFGTAVLIARSLGATRHLERLRRVITIDELDHVQLRDRISPGDLRILDTGSVNHRPGPAPREPALLGSTVFGSTVREPDGGPDRLVVRRCPRGHVTRTPDARYCEELDCDYEFADASGTTPG
jgi:Mg-chelatase subunit ChlD